MAKGARLEPAGGRSCERSSRARSIDVPDAVRRSMRKTGSSGSSGCSMTQRRHRRGFGGASETRPIAHRRGDAGHRRRDPSAATRRRLGHEAGIDTVVDKMETRRRLQGEAAAAASAGGSIRSSSGSPTAPPSSARRIVRPSASRSSPCSRRMPSLDERARQQQFSFVNAENETELVLYRRNDGDYALSSRSWALHDLARRSVGIAPLAPPSR